MLGTAKRHGRKVQCSFFADYLQKVRGYPETKAWHGLHRLRLRGLMNANIQGLLTAAGQHLKRILAATGWGQHRAPSRSPLALSTESQGLSAV
jgi:hypothetical protein